MKVEEFITKCVSSKYDWSQGKHNETEGYFVGSEKLDTCAHFTAEAIEKNAWPALHKQITQGKDVHQITRIVGYYSRIQNWNKSKLGELQDRHAGDYKISK